MDAVGRIGRALADFGAFYWHPTAGFQNRMVFHKGLGNWREALVLFLKDYAFERLGRSPLYPRAASESVQAYPHPKPQADLESFLWDEFQRRIAPQSPNERLNPLAPSTGSVKSIAVLILELGPDLSLIRWAKEALEDGNAGEVFGKLQQVRGIGPKIAAFFLRDVADAFELDITDPEEAIYLQPIDRWTRRGAESLAPLIGASRPRRDEGCVQILLEVARQAGVRPTLLNSGLWVFGAQFVKSEEGLRRILSDTKVLERYLKRWRDESKARLDLLETIQRGLFSKDNALQHRSP